MDMRVVAVARLSRGVMAACALQATFCRCAGKPRSLSAQWRRVSVPSTMPDPAGLGPRVVARTPRCVRSLRWASTKTPSSPLTGTDFTFPSSLLGPTVRAQVDPCAPLFGSRTSRRRYEWIVYDLSLEDVDRIEHGGGPGHVRNPDGPEHRSCNNFRSIEPALSPPAPPVAPCSALANKRERGRVALRNYRTLCVLLPSPLGEKPTFSFHSPEVVSTAENAPCSAQPNAR